VLIAIRLISARRKDIPAMLSHLDRDGLMNVIAFSVFFASPIVLNYAIQLQDWTKRKINQKLAPHGLRLKER